MKLINDLEKILITEQQIDEACIRLAKQITEDYEGIKPLFLGILKGCHPFMTDLLRHVDLYHDVDYMDVSSYYGGVKSSGEVKIIKDINSEVKDRDIVIVEDIVESGNTIKKVKELLLFRGAKSVEVVTMIDKPSGRVAELEPRYIGYTLPDGFLVGYGLDLAEMYRNIRVIGIPKQSVVEKFMKESDEK